MATFNQKILISVVAIVFATFLYLLKPILMPFLLGGFLAYLGDPLVARLQKFKLPRTVAALLVFLLIFLIVALFFTLFIPLLQRQTVILLQKIPNMLSAIQTDVIPWLNMQASNFNVDTTIDPKQIQTLVSEHWQQAGSVLTSVAQTVTHSSGAVITWVINILLIPVVTFYLLRDWPKLLASLEELLPRKQAQTWIPICHECDEVLSAFFRGQLLVMLALAIIYAVGLSICGLQVAVLIGLLAGLLSIVPYLGFSVGLISALLAALVQFHDGKHLLYVLIVFIVGNILEGMVLTPWLVGDKIGLHPVAVIFAVLAGGHLFGFFGILLALPAAAVLMVLLHHVKRSYKSSTLYQ